MKHILFVPPYGWESEFLMLDLPSRKVSWLMALPISDAELKFFHETESGELENLFAEKHIDMCDLNRKSVL
jgi:antitoxin YqcF